MEKRDYNREMEEVLSALGEERPRLLLHSCCGPCSSAVLERLLPHFQPDIYYYNPNIDTPEEFQKRLDTQALLLSRLPGAEHVCLIPGEYDHDRFLSYAHGLEGEPEGGARCALCFRLRLEETARRAREDGYPYFATTLTVSPHKNPAVINPVGFALESPGLRFLPSDFKKKDGYLRSIRLSKEYGLYRQEYCGCGFGKV